MHVGAGGTVGQPERACGCQRRLALRARRRWHGRCAPGRPWQPGHCLALRARRRRRGRCAPGRLHALRVTAHVVSWGGDVLHANQAPLPVIWRHSRSSAFPRALDAVTECSQSTHPTHRWVRKPGSPFEEHFGQQAPVAQLTDRRPQVSLSVIARLLVPEQLSRHVLQGGPVGPSQQALQRVRSRL